MIKDNINTQKCCICGKIANDYWPINIDKEILASAYCKFCLINEQSKIKNAIEEIDNYNKKKEVNNENSM